jgi:hypothetical protein
MQRHCHLPYMYGFLLHVTHKLELDRRNNLSLCVTREGRRGRLGCQLSRDEAEVGPARRVGPLTRSSGLASPLPHAYLWQRYSKRYIMSFYY